MRIRPFLYLTVILVCLTGCRGERGYRPLIPTPVVYTDSDIDPFDHLAQEDRTTHLEVFYATNREAEGELDDRRYTNSMDDRVHVGRVSVQLGDEDTTWEELHLASTVAEREKPFPVTLEKVEEFGVLRDSLGEAQALDAVCLGDQAKEQYGDKTDILDITYSKKTLKEMVGFAGHRYWYDNAWISTDILLSIYLDLLPGERGLTKAVEYEDTWYFTEDYPQRVIEACKGLAELENLEK